MQILIHHGKHGDEFYNISTPSLCRGAYRHLFDELRSEGHYECCEPKVPKELALFDKACKGDDVAAMQFIQLRSQIGYEYEKVEMADVHEIEGQ